MQNIYYYESKKGSSCKGAIKKTKTQRLDLLRWLVASWETSGKRIQMQSPINALAQQMAARSANTSFQWDSGKKWWWWSIAVCCCRTHKPWSKSWMKTQEAEFDSDSRANLTNMNNTVSQKSRGTRVSRISMPRFCILDQLFLFRSAHHKAQQFAILCAPGWYTTGLNKSQKMPKDQQSKLKVWSKLTPMLETSESRYAFIDKSCTKSDKCSHYTVRSPVSCTRTEVIGDLRKKSPFQNACGHPFHTLQYNHILTIIFGRIKSTTG